MKASLSYKIKKKYDESIIFTHLYEKNYEQ